MSDPYFFGYGSLVNVGSHAYGPTSRAILRGWRRRWRATHLRPAAFLTGVPEPGIEIEGLVAPVPGADWAALDLREGGYDRVEAAGLAHDLGPDAQVAVYAIPERTPAADVRCPILLSYLDVVVKGYLDQFGEAGVTRFMQTTDGWEVAHVDDRDAPLYPRAQDVGGEVLALTDLWLDRMGCPRIDLAETELGHAG